jgi:hypothetical protein
LLRSAGFAVVLLAVLARHLTPIAVGDDRSPVGLGNPRARLTPLTTATRKPVGPIWWPRPLSRG